MFKQTKAKISNNSLLNKVNLSIFAVLFAGIGGYFIISSFALTPACDYTYNTTQKTTFQSTVSSSASAGKTICLEAGNYGSLSLTDVSKSADVTITAKDPAAPPTISVWFINSSHIKITNSIISGDYVQKGKYLTFTNNKFNAYFRLDGDPAGNQNILFDSNTFDDINDNGGLDGRLSISGGGSSSTPSGITISNNHFSGGNTDGIYLTNGPYGVQIGPGNEFSNIRNSGTRHTDPIQLAGSSGTLITGNYLHDNDSGIMAPDGSKDEKIINNVIATLGYACPINLGGAISNSVLHNTLVNGATCITRANNCGTESSNNIFRDNIGGTSLYTGFDNSTPPKPCPGTTTGYLTASDHNISPNQSDFIGPLTSHDGYLLKPGATAGKNASSDTPPKDIGIYALTAPSPPSGGTANVWIDNDGGTCAFSLQAMAYDSAKACSGSQAIQAALNAIGTGKGPTSVKVMPGTYVGQYVQDDTRAESDRVTFTEYGGDASFEYLDFHGDSVTFDGFTFNRPYRTVDYQEGVSVVGTNNQSKGVKLLNNIIQGGVYLSNTSGVQVKGGEICCTMANSTHDQKVLTANGSNSVYDTTIDGVEIHDARRAAAGDHAECAFLMSVRKFTIKNSHFYNCTVYNVSLGRLGSDPDPSDVTFENNVFEHTDNLIPGAKDGLFNLSLGHVSTKYTNLIFRNNSFESQIQFFNVLDKDSADVDTPPGAYSDTWFYSNIFEISGYSGRCTTDHPVNIEPHYDYNIFDKVTTGCGTHVTIVNDSRALWKNPAGHDFSLKAKNGAGHPTISIAPDTTPSSTATDILGITRPQGSAPDAGAYEYNSGGTTTCTSTKTADINCDNIVSVIDLSLLLNNYSKTTSQLTNPRADIITTGTSAGKVDISDLSALLSQYGK